MCTIQSIVKSHQNITTISTYSSDDLIYIMHYKTFQEELFVLILEVVFKF